MKALVTILALVGSSAMASGINPYAPDLGLSDMGCFELMINQKVYDQSIANGMSEDDARYEASTKSYDQSAFDMLVQAGHDKVEAKVLATNFYYRDSSTRCLYVRADALLKKDIVILKAISEVLKNASAQKN